MYIHPQNGWRDAASALPFVKQGKQDKHYVTGRSHGFDFIQFGFSTFGSLSPTATKLLSHICQRYSSHARIPKWEACACVFRQLSFAVTSGFAGQFVDRKLPGNVW